MFEALAECDRDVVVTLGVEGKAQWAIDPERIPHTAAMAATLQKVRAEWTLVHLALNLPPRRLAFHEGRTRGTAVPSLLHSLDRDHDRMLDATFATALAARPRDTVARERQPLPDPT